MCIEMGSRKRFYRHSFYGTTLADETRKEKRFNQVRQRRLSAFAEVDHVATKQEDNWLTKSGYNSLFGAHLRRERSNSLPNPTLLDNIVNEMKNETLNNISRPRSASFDPTAKLYTATAENDTTELERLLDSGKADPNRLYLSGVAPLHIAAAEGYLESIKVLVQYNADINILDLEGCSPLEFALRGAHFDCASYLIKLGAETEKIIDGVH